MGRSANISDDQFRKILDNNIIANHWLISFVAPQMIERKEGSIVIVSSVGGLKASTTIGAYNVSKAADFQLARNLAAEFGPHNVRVNCIAPGLIRTDFARALWENPDNLKVYNARTPLGRIGEPDEIAGAAVFLALAGEHVHDRPGDRRRRRRDDQLISEAGRLDQSRDEPCCFCGRALPSLNCRKRGRLRRKGYAGRKRWRPKRCRVEPIMSQALDVKEKAPCDGADAHPVRLGEALSAGPRLGCADRPRHGSRPSGASRSPTTPTAPPSNFATAS